MLVQDVVCLLLCGAATVTDLRSYRIPNWMTMGGIACGLLLNALLVRHGWLNALGGAMLTGVVFGVFGAMGFVGMGDVKLMTAVGALVSWPLAVVALAWVGLAGGVVAIAFAIGRGQLGSVLRGLGTLARRAVGRGGGGAEAPLHRIPYAVAILLGTTFAIAARYVPALRLL